MKQCLTKTKLTTSQRIALRFACTIATIVLFLGVIINIAFFGSWRKREQQHVARFAPQGQEDIFQFQKAQRKFAKTMGGEFGPRNMLFVPRGSEAYQELRENTLFANVAHIDDEWYMYDNRGPNDQLLVVDISPVIQNQLALLRITLIMLVVSSGIGYFIAIYTVKKGLRDLHVLTEYVQSIDIDSLHTPVSFPHLPVHDEIQIVRCALDEMTTKLHNQIGAIRQFVANVSHEFKTPLMSLQSTLDVAEKTKRYEELFGRVRHEISTMHRLLDTLTMLTHMQTAPTIEKTTHNVADVIAPLVYSLTQHYPDVIFETHIDPTLTIQTHRGFFERIVSNLLDNAGKFTPAGGKVTLTCDVHQLVITDTGTGISPEYLQQIREPFWQGDAARGTQGFGLGLALVQQLITLLDRQIVVKSAVGTGTTVTIHFE